MELEIDAHALDAMRNISKCLKTICCSMGNDLVTQNDVTKSALNIVLERMSVITQREARIVSEYEAVRKPDSVI